MPPSRALSDDQAVRRAARELGKISWQKRKAREDACSARVAELEAENAQLRTRLAEQSASDKNHEMT